ncbi:hypothetical protein F2Q69_00020219 [Brassica cretica]|uniref:Uncharacterized protein n=1 Tax=Brassica cretica TaxID=69181 RepID=A0A8S9QK65_BRACR|nr:hypothetical protein F2Q69_00020219 [Brassica cretica]
MGFERLRRIRRSHAPALSLSLSSPFGRSLGSGSTAEIRRDFRAFSVVRRSFRVELLLILDSNFHFRKFLKSSSTGVSSFSSSDDKFCWERAEYTGLDKAPSKPGTSGRLTRLAKTQTLQPSHDPQDEELATSERIPALHRLGPQAIEMPPENDLEDLPVLKRKPGRPPG